MIDYKATGKAVQRNAGARKGIGVFICTIAMAFKLKVKRPKAFNKQGFTTSLIDGYKSLAKDITKDFDKTVSTWTHKPKFSVLVQSTAQQIEAHFSYQDSEGGGKRYTYLDEGTRVRYALMSRDWISKTKPSIGSGAGVHLSSGAGRGHVVVIRRDRPRPGIKARGWTKAIAEKWKRSIKSDMEKHLSKAVRESGHAVTGGRRK